MSKKYDRQVPSYSWGLHPKQTVYQSKDMLDAIEVALKNMTRYPDAEKIIAGFKKDETR